MENPSSLRIFCENGKRIKIYTILFVQLFAKIKLSMKIIIVLFISCVLCGICNSQNITSSTASPNVILAKLSKKLNSLKNIIYHNTRELNYSSENYHNKTGWVGYLDFESTDTIIGFKYQIEDSTQKQFFNGTEKFELNKKTKTIQINDHPVQNSFSNLSAFYNSIITLKNVLPALIKDETATKNLGDTIINKKSYYVIRFDIHKRRIQNLGSGFDAMQTKSNFIYKIIIDPNADLPFMVLQENDINSDFIKTTFTAIETNVSKPAELSWYYSTYINEYKPAEQQATPQVLGVGSSAPGWKLQLYNKDKMIALDDLKGKVVLLDFWIKNCGPCIASVPHLNELQKKFADKNFEIISINSYDPKEDVKWFCNKHKVSYNVLLNGKEVAQLHGVSAFPTFFVVDKEGKIIYAGTGYDETIEKKIEQSIDSAL